MSAELDLDAIEAAAQKAFELTAAEWEAGERWVYTMPLYEDDNRLMSIFRATYSDPERQQTEHHRGNANAVFVAAANPLAVLALVAEVRTLRNRLTGLEELARLVADDLRDRHSEDYDVKTGTEYCTHDEQDYPCRVLTLLDELQIPAGEGEPSNG